MNKKRIVKNKSVSPPCDTYIIDKKPATKGPALHADIDSETKLFVGVQRLFDPLSHILQVILAQLIGCTRDGCQDF